MADSAKYSRIFYSAILGLLIIGNGCYWPISGQKVLQKKCINCHTLAIIEGSRKTRREWKITISRMIEYGVRLNSRQIRELANYLTLTYGPENP